MANFFVKLQKYSVTVLASTARSHFFVLREFHPKLSLSVATNYFPS